MSTTTDLDRQSGTRIDDALGGLVAALDPAAPGGVSGNKCLAGKLGCVAARGSAFLASWPALPSMT